MKDWTSTVIDELCDCKRAGLGFEESWAAVIKRHRPGRRDLGVVAEDLFEAAREDAESLPQFLKRSCEDAWFNRRPELRHLAVLLESGAAFPVVDQHHYQPAAVGKYRSAA